jgi:hypothetical protein
MPARKVANKRTKSLSPVLEWEGLLEAARAVVKAHHLRDRDEADDSDVSDAISELEERLPRKTRTTRMP